MSDTQRLEELLRREDVMCSSSVTAIVAEHYMSRLSDEEIMQIGARMHMVCALEDKHEGPHVLEITEEIKLFCSCGHASSPFKQCAIPSHIMSGT